MLISTKRVVPALLCLASTVSMAMAQNKPQPTETKSGGADLSSHQDKPMIAPHAGGAQAGTPAEPPPPVDPNAPVMVKPEPAELDLGEIATMDSKAGTLKLINTDTKPRTVHSVRPSCGCTTLKFVPDTVIPPGESIDVEVQLNGGAMPGPLLHKTVTVSVDGQPDVVVALKAMAVSFVNIDPAALDPQTMKDGKFKLKSVDGQAFRIMSMQPPVIEGFPSDAKAEHELTVDWDHFREVGAQRRVTFYLDHPKCTQASAMVNFTNEEIMKGMKTDTFPTKDGGKIETPPAPIDPDVVLQNLIKEHKNAEVLEKIKNGMDVNYTAASSRMSVLSMAALAGNVDLMTALLQAGADKESIDNVGRTPLMHAAQSKNPAAIRIMLDAGASVTARDQIGGTALSWAAGLGDAPCVQELIDAGADVEVVGLVTGWTPLIWASGFGDPASIPVLVKAGANLEARDILQGATPLIHAARTGRVEGIKALIKAGAKLESKDNAGKTALLAAAENSGGTYDKVQALIEAGADIHAKDNRKLNALQLARKRTDIRAPEVIKVLEPLLGKETPAEEHATASAEPKQPTMTATPAGDAGKAGQNHADHDH
jgi:ankyrin repeat protein